MKLRTLSALLIIILALSCFTLTPISAGSSPTTSTVNLASITKNASGDGYTWNNLDDVLTLDGLNIRTDDEYGMKIPSNATVVLKGDNYISAKSVGLACPGPVTFEGNGTLTIVAEDTGIDFTSLHPTELVRFRSGTFTISAGKTGLNSEHSDLSLMGSKITVSITGNRSEGKSIDGRVVTLSGGTFKANAGIYATHSLKITSMNAEVSALGTAALNSMQDIQITKTSIRSGESETALNYVETYNGESVVKLTSTSTNDTKGILFNGKYPIFVDYLVFFLLLIVIAALIAVPIYLKKRKTDKLIAKYKAENAAKAKTTAKNSGKPTSEKSKTTAKSTTKNK